MTYDVVIIGGGAAGLFCAIEAGKRGRKTLVIEHNTQVGRKIIISGGGRCNFTNINTTPENFISENPHFCKSALARYTPQDLVELVKKHKIEFYEKKLGQLFCRERSYLIVEMLLAECEKAKADVLTDLSVTAVRNEGGSTRFSVETRRGNFKCESLVIASGGLSFPKIGASSFGYKIADQFDIRRTETRPSLVPLVAAGKPNFQKLAGVSVDSIVLSRKVSFRENILFTHRGLSGPAILQVSNYWTPGEAIGINLLPDIDPIELLEKNSSSTQTVGNFLSRFLPQRFIKAFAEQNLPNKALDQLTKKEIEQTAEILQNWQMEFNDTEGYDKAEVTLGGVSTDELSSQTMESKKAPGLYFIGEVVDVTGWLGGYNFQWAWSSAFAAGQAV